MSSSPSLGQQFIAANSFDDWFPNFSREEQTSGPLAQEAARDFIKWVDSEYPGEWHPSPENSALIQKFMEVNDVCPASLRNYKISFLYLRAEGLLQKASAEADEPEEAKVKYSRPVVMRVHKSAEEQEQEKELVTTLHKLDRITPRSQKRVDVGSGLRQLYVDSLNENKNGGRAKHLNLGEARSMVAKQYPQLQPDTPEFNQYVAWLMYDQSE